MEARACEPLDSDAVVVPWASALHSMAVGSASLI